MTSGGSSENTAFHTVMNLVSSNERLGFFVDDNVGICVLENVVFLDYAKTANVDPDPAPLPWRFHNNNNTCALNNNFKRAKSQSFLDSPEETRFRRINGDALRSTMMEGR